MTESTVPVINTVPFLCVPFGSGKEMLRRKEKLPTKLPKLTLYVSSYMMYLKPLIPIGGLLQ